MSETISEKFYCLTRTCTIPDDDDIDGIFLYYLLELLTCFTSTVEVYLIEVDGIPESVEDSELASCSESWVDSEEAFSIFWLGHEEVPEIPRKSLYRIELTENGFGGLEGE